MRTIEVKASKGYRVLVGRGLLADVGGLMRQAGRAGSVLVVCDDRVAPLYLQAVQESLCMAGFAADSFVFPHGEESKNLATYARLLSHLAKKGLTKSDTLLALGGGVVGDLTGFAAATYLRGLGFVQAPTTLLAAVDSSVGGKTAVDLPEGKNLVGSFYQPELVVMDMETLKTLPAEEYACGMAEVIKYGVLGDRDLFDQVKEGAGRFDEEAVVARCIQMKADIVREDEFDEGKRQLLNLGHTLGHAVEKASGLTIPHGQARGPSAWPAVAPRSLEAGPERGKLLAANPTGVAGQPPARRLPLWRAGAIGRGAVGQEAQGQAHPPDPAAENRRVLPA